MNDVFVMGAGASRAMSACAHEGLLDALELIR